MESFPKYKKKNREEKARVCFADPAMSPVIDKEKSDLPSPKRQKTEDCDGRGSADYSSDEATDEQMREFDQYLLTEGGEGFEIDFKKFRYYFGWKSMDLDDSTWADAPDTNREFIANLSNMALTKHNADNQTSLELGKIVSANYRLSCGISIYISFLVKDPSCGNQTKPYRAVVRYLPVDPVDIEVVSCGPKPTS